MPDKLRSQVRVLPHGDEGTSALCLLKCRCSRSSEAMWLLLAACLSLELSCKHGQCVPSAAR